MERQEEQKRKFCEMLFLPYHSSKLAVQMKGMRALLESGKAQRLAWLKGMEI
jgi:hypothetical protein